MIENLWIDDIRRPPDRSWVWARTIEMAKLAVTNSEPFVAISLDHDMGLENYDPDEQDADLRRVPTMFRCSECVMITYEAEINIPPEACHNCGASYLKGFLEEIKVPNGVDFAKWLVFQSAHKMPPRIYIHSMNNVGAINMANVLKDHTHVIIQPYQRWYKE